MQDRITAILSDYDGTLCPTNSVRNQDGTIPKELRQVTNHQPGNYPITSIAPSKIWFSESADYRGFLNRQNY
jgi:hypothetical protein